MNVQLRQTDTTLSPALLTPNSTATGSSARPSTQQAKQKGLPRRIRWPEYSSEKLPSFYSPKLHAFNSTEVQPVNDILTHDTNTQLQKLLHTLTDIFRDEEEEVRPTTHAFELTYDLLVAAQEHISVPLPRATVSTDDAGGVFVFWRDGPRKLHLHMPSRAEEQSYLYHEEGTDYSVVYGISPVVLVDWLQWYAAA